MTGGRSFSFEDNDEQALSSNLDGRLEYHDRQQQPPLRYEYPVDRNIVSPPPQYSSPPPREYTVSPPSPDLSPAPLRLQTARHERQQSDIPPRRPVPSPRADPSPAPPPPPPHRTSPGQSERYISQTYSHRSYSSASTEPSNYDVGSDEPGPHPRSREALHTIRNMNMPAAARSPQRTSPPQGYYAEEPSFYTPPRTRNRVPDRDSHASYASNAPLAGGAATPGFVTPTRASPNAYAARYSPRREPVDDYSTPIPSPHGHYQDSPYHNSSHSLNHAVDNANINPYNIADDGDDGFIPDPKRKSVVGVMRQRSNEQFGPNGSSEKRASPGAFGGIAGIFNRKPKAPTSSGSYNRVQEGPSEKSSRSEWLSRQTKGNNRMRWVVGAAIITVVLLAVIAGIIGGVVSSRKSASNTNPNSNDNTAAGDEQANGDLGRDSPQIKALLNNPNLHKVFPGIDYTPWGTQYPLCLTYPPSQNNVTRDMAVLSQLTNAVRLYGTDCNQTQMVLHAIDRLQLTDMKVWLGVWVDTNDTTTERQIDQMYSILESVPDMSIFKGVIIGNEALYRAGLDKAQSEEQLIGYLTDAKQRFASAGYKLPIATSDLGTNWNTQLVEAVDLVMSNIHPFFGGVPAPQAASWTWTFWQENDVVLSEGMAGKTQIISETGWPSEGGRDCGGDTGECYGSQTTGSEDAAIASVDNMNIYMNDWVCQALDNGTEYFWFEAFDEPWKIVYDKGDQNWETAWGLMDPGRNLKDGLVIPDCGGKTVDKR